MCFVLSATLAVVAIPTLIPINYFASDDETSSSSNNTTEGVNVAQLTLDRFSMINVPDGSSLLIIHVIFVYVVSVFLFMLLYSNYKRYTDLGTKYLKEDGVLTKKGPLWRRGENLQLRTIMVQNVPPDHRSDEKLRRWFESLNIGEVESVVMDQVGSEKTMKILARRNRTLQKLECAYTQWVKNIEREKKRRRRARCWKGPGWAVGTRLAFWRSWFVRSQVEARSGTLDATIDTVGLRHVPLEENDHTDLTADADVLDEATLQKLRPVRRKRRWTSLKNLPSSGADAIEHYTTKLDSLTRVIKERRLQALGPDPSDLESSQRRVYGTTGFVTFKTQRAAQIAAQTLLYSAANPWTMVVRMAPAPQDIVWESLSMPIATKHIRRLTVSLVFLVICFFLIIPTSAISSLFNMEKLAHIPGFQEQMKELLEDQTMTFIIQTIGPPLIVNTINWVIIPYVFECVYEADWQSRSFNDSHTTSLHMTQFK
ncbi:hypothetical protein HK102_001475 [Quaeritorhiza haematococci]|nr:hypothetical protein HK102_001475 [Quaeritorhiza haematococci]